MSNTVGTEACLDTKALDEILGSIPDVGPDDLVPILQQVQNAYGYLPKPILMTVSERTGIAAARIFGVASFRSKRMQKFKIETYQNLLQDVGGATAENLFMFLGKVQEAFGYVPREVVRDVAAKTGFSETRIYGALTSYRDFKVHSQCDG